MRILIAHEAFSGAGGVESYLSCLIPALQARGHHVAVLHYDCRDERGPTDVAPEGTEAFGFRDLGATKAISEIRRWNPDVCFSHNMRPLDLEELVAAEWPVVKMMHGYFGTCISSQKCHMFPAPTACARPFAASCLSMYLPRRCGQLRPLKMLEQFAWTTRQHRLLATYAHVVVASRHMAAEYERNGVPPSDLSVVPLFPTVPAPASPRPKPGRPTVLFAGRMTDLKGAAVLVRAVAHTNRIMGRSVRLVMAGDGPQKARVASLARELQVETSLPGWLSGEARVDAIRRASIVVVPSLWPEPFGLAGLEAALHGVPAVAFDVGGISEWLRDGINGRLVDPRQGAPALGAAVADVLGDDVTREALERGATAAARRLSVEAHVSRIENVLAAAVRERSVA